MGGGGVEVVRSTGVCVANGTTAQSSAARYGVDSDTLLSDSNIMIRKNMGPIDPNIPSDAGHYTDASAAG